MTGVVFRTNRLSIRGLQATDVDAIFTVYSDPIGCRWVGDGKPITMNECVQWVAVTHKNYQVRGYGMYTAVHRELDEIIGFGGIVHPGGQEAAEIKYAIHPQWWGQGLATELAAGLLCHAVESHNLSRVISTISSQNTASLRVAERIGMNHYDSRREDDESITEVFEYTAAKAT